MSIGVGCGVIERTQRRVERARKAVASSGASKPDAVERPRARRDARKHGDTLVARQVLRISAQQRIARTRCARVRGA